MARTDFHRLDADQALAALDSRREAGLDDAEAARRLAADGPNELKDLGGKSPWSILWEQIASTMVVVLLIATLISGLMGDLKDAIAIFIIVILNALLGFNQEYRAEKAIAALKRLAVPTVKIRRGGRVLQIGARDLVRGDLVMLEAGNLVPADGRVIESFDLRVQEAALTGESEPVQKNTAVLDVSDPALGDRHNMVHMGTMVAWGRGTAVITATGMDTELGAVASMIQTVRREATPLQKRLSQVSAWLAWAALVIVAMVMAMGLIRGENWRVMLLTAVSLAVAAVPEGLPAVVTIVLSLGAKRMLKRHALIRKLPAVETLGSVTVICSDKTGTLTENRMTVTVLDVPGHRVELRGDEPSQPNSLGAPLTLEGRSGVGLLLLAGALCNDAILSPDESGLLRAVGDPTEGALIVAAARFGLRKPELEAALPRVAEVPFDADRKRMTTIHRLPGAGIPSPLPADGLSKLGSPGAWLALVKGAPDGLLALTTRVFAAGGPQPMDEAARAGLLAANERLAREGMRVIGVAVRPLAALPAPVDAAVENDLVFVGLVGIIDPPRREVSEAVATCRAAGIRPVMITGDHPLTAAAIARQLGMEGDGGTVSGAELSGAGDEDYTAALARASIFARVSPEHKLRLVEALQRGGEIVAMTGDGVNDAPALKRADIGVAMGLSGTDVAKEAADMVLLDDNFATIVAAVEEGRVIYDNIRKFILYILSSNVGEIMVMFIAPFLGMPVPLLPLQILWINLLTDGLPALALGVEPAEGDTMRRPPHRPQESIFGRGMGPRIVWVGLLMGLVALIPGWWYWRRGDAHWQTMIFSILILAQMGNVLAVRSERESFRKRGPATNPALLASVVLMLVLQVAVVYLPWLQSIFHTVAMPGRDAAFCLAASAVVFGAIEIAKWWCARQTDNVSTSTKGAH